MVLSLAATIPTPGCTLVPQTPVLIDRSARSAGAFGNVQEHSRGSRRLPGAYIEAVKYCGRACSGKILL